MVAGDTQEDVHSGAVIFVPAGEARVKAETRLVALHVIRTSMTPLSW